MDATTPNAEQGLIQLAGAPDRWIWAFTCPTPRCACRTAIVLSMPGAREALLERGRPVAEAWLGHESYAEAALQLRGVTVFGTDLDTRELFALGGDAPLHVNAHPEVKAVAERLDDDALDAIARAWHLGKGQEPPPEPGALAAKIEVEDWQPGDRVMWDDVMPFLRADTYVFGDRIFEAFELYCVEAGCACGEVIVEFSSVAPRGAPRPGHVEFDGKEALLHPEHERQRARLTELWSAYCQRHRDHRERFAKRSATTHGLAGRIVAAPPKPKVGRNETCPCGSGKKFKKCCGTA